jgi:hypothetical protein
MITPEILNTLMDAGYSEITVLRRMASITTGNPELDRAVDLALAAYRIGPIWTPCLTLGDVSRP